jgi:hypothetical protein
VALGFPARLRPRIFSTFGTTRVVGRRPNAPAAFTPGEIPGTHFQSTWFCRKELWKKSQVTPPGIDPGTVRLAAQRLNHYATGLDFGTLSIKTTYKMSESIHSLSRNSCGNFSILCLGQPCKGLTDARSFHTTWANTSCLGKPLNHAVNFRIKGKKIHILGRNQFDGFSLSRLPRHTRRLLSQYSSFWRLLQIWASTKDFGVRRAEK